MAGLQRAFHRVSTRSSLLGWANDSSPKLSRKGGIVQRVPVRDSIVDSVWNSILAYTGSFFALERGEWKQTEKIETEDYPFAPAVKLWEMGLVPSFDGKIWRLHGGKEGKALFQITVKKLRSERVSASLTRSVLVCWERKRLGGG